MILIVYLRQAKVLIAYPGNKENPYASKKIISYNTDLLKGKNHMFQVFISSKTKPILLNVAYRQTKIVKTEMTNADFFNKGTVTCKSIRNVSEGCPSMNAST